MIKLTLTIHEDADVQTIINALERTQTHLTLEVELRPGKVPEPAAFKRPSAIKSFKEAFPIIQSAKDDWFNTSITVAAIQAKYGINYTWFYKYYGNRTGMKRGKRQNILQKKFPESTAKDMDFQKAVAEH